MGLTYELLLDDAAGPEALRDMLVAEHGFKLLDDWRAKDGTPWLASEHGLAFVQARDRSRRREHGLPFEATVAITLDPNKRLGGDEHLCRVAAAIFRKTTGDAALFYDTGPLIAVRRGGLVRIEPDAPAMVADIDFGARQAT